MRIAFESTIKGSWADQASDPLLIHLVSQAPMLEWIAGEALRLQFSVTNTLIEYYGK